MRTGDVRRKPRWQPKKTLCPNSPWGNEKKSQPDEWKLMAYLWLNKNLVNEQQLDSISALNISWLCVQSPALYGRVISPQQDVEKGGISRKAEKHLRRSWTLLVRGGFVCEICTFPKPYEWSPCVGKCLLQQTERSIHLPLLFTDNYNLNKPQCCSRFIGLLGILQENINLWLLYLH